MNSSRQDSSFAPGPMLLTGLIVAATLTRLLPHPPNFSPVEAIALFAGAYFASRSWAILVPLAGMLISDLALALAHGGLYIEHLASMSSLAVYLCILLTTLLGFGMRGKVNGARVLGYSLAGSVLFFVVTNFAVWLTAGAVPGYMACQAGLLPCYIAAVPFFKWTLLGTLFYAALLFGGFSLLRRRIPILHARTI